MTQQLTIAVPDLGDLDQAEVVEVLIKKGDALAEGQTLMTLESDKALIEVPATEAGDVVEVHIRSGQMVKTGDPMVTLAFAELPVKEQPVAGSASVEESKPASESAADAGVKAVEPSAEKKDGMPEPEIEPETESEEESDTASETVRVPDLGDIEQAEIVELLVSVGDQVVADQTVMTLESDKALLEVPSSMAGKVAEIWVRAGQSVSSQQPLMALAIASSAASSVASNQTVESPVESESKPNQKLEMPPVLREVAAPADIKPVDHNKIPAPAVNAAEAVYAGPAVRRLANQLGVDLTQVPPTGPRKRILKEDVKAYVKQHMTNQGMTQPVEAAGSSVAAVSGFPEIDFSQWGDVTSVKVSRIQKKTAELLTRSWSQIPQVTQFDSADITELEAFRKTEGARLKPTGVKLTMVAFLVKASAYVLRAMPQFNSSLSPDQTTLHQKDYVHIGVAVDTPNGLLVPVIRDADKKSVIEIANDVVALSGKAREGKLSPDEMKGGCFSVSSLGGLGGTAFTPLVNWPEVAILGVSRSKLEPVWQAESKAFEPRLMLPLSLSYDHRVINGADAARFTTLLGEVLADMRKVLL